MKSLKKMFVVVLILLIPAGFVLAQTDKGDKEFSITASFMAMKPEDGDTTSGLHLAGRVGYFFTKNLEIEPEVVIGKFEEVDMGYVLSLNLAYNFTDSSKTVPFVLGGAGICNTFWLFPIPNIVLGGFEGETFTVLNAGAGVKVFLSKTVALRAEYRFQYLFDSDGYITYHYALIGISAFLK